MLLIWSIVFGLATWRVSSLITRETGPFRIFERVRTRAGVYEVGEISGLAELFSCVWCMSVWVGSAFAVAATIALADYQLLLTALPASTVAIIVETYARK